MLAIITSILMSLVSAIFITALEDFCYCCPHYHSAGKEVESRAGWSCSLRTHLPQVWCEGLTGRCPSVILKINVAF